MNFYLFMIILNAIFILIGLHNFINTGSIFGLICNSIALIGFTLLYLKG